MTSSYRNTTVVRPTEECGKVLSEKNDYMKSVNTALLLSKVIDADHQNSCLFTHKGHFSSGLNWVFMINTLPIVLTRLLDYISTINSVKKLWTHMTTMLPVGSL